MTTHLAILSVIKVSRHKMINMMAIPLGILYGQKNIKKLKNPFGDDIIYVGS